ncbi:XRE family transcriptional regulator [Bifidobacterium sp. ESL0745]|uniref:helix-turn-helix transcriptional regulator n=1 Tax=Bifidobacterium sp. ESL0745 TaxID=2983226 RepID=UPI0023F9BBEF|nr:XRE family transcriptional regulator [Bifidobacterium sp. ESL0745]MDF7665690.1 XRE family transcriptional regulator [Bifidobacterium sp. ESL0745]
MAERYLSLTEVADRLSVATATVAKLNLPEPDAWIGRTRGWRADTIDEWNANRPGHGGRPRKRD